MSYLSLESSLQDGQPIVLFQFVQGAITYRYTGAARQVTALGFDWTPVAINGSPISQSQDMQKDRLSVKIPRDDALAATFLGYVPDVVTTVTVYRGHIGDGEWATNWKGRVSGYSATAESVTLECEQIFSSLRRPGLRARFQRPCRHVLYGRGCRLDSADFATVMEITAVDGAVVTAPDAAGLDSGFLIGGMLLSPDGVLRYIVNHVGDQITLIRPVKSLIETPSGDVTVYPGCDHTRETCETKFSNLDNFGGFPWMPGKNPFVSGIK